MYAIVFRVLPKPRDRQKLIDFLKWNCKVASQKEPGTLRFDVIADPESDMIYVYEAYESRPAFEKHQKHEPYRKWISEIGPNLKEFRNLFEGNPVCFVKAQTLKRLSRRMPK